MQAIAALGAVAAVLPSWAAAGAEPIDTDLEAIGGAPNGPSVFVIYGDLTAAKNRCVGGRSLTIRPFSTGRKRGDLDLGPVLDTDRSSADGAWVFSFDVDDLDGFNDGFHVKAKAKQLRGPASCDKATTEFGI